MRRMLSFAQACVLIDRSAPVVREWRRSGMFPAPAVDPNGSEYWPEDVVNAWLTLLNYGYFKFPVKSKASGKNAKEPETAGNNRADEEAD